VADAPDEGLPYTEDAAASDLMGLLGDDLTIDHGDEELETKADDVTADRLETPGDETEDEVEETEDEVEESEEAEDEETEEADEETEEETDEPDFYEVKIDGETYEVTLEEALQGYQRQEAFTRGTTANAREREANAQELNATRAERQQYAERLVALDEALASVMPQEPDWEQVKRDNPTEYPVQYAEYQRGLEQRRVLATEAQRVANLEEETAKAQFATYVEGEKAKLLEAIPEWDDEAVATKEKTDLVDFAQEAYGWTPEEIGAVTDHRAIRMLRDAAAYRRSIAKGQQIRRKGGKRKAVALKPGAKPATTRKRVKKSANKRVQAAQARLRKTGDELDAADSIFHSKWLDDLE